MWFFCCCCFFFLLYLKFKECENTLRRVTLLHNCNQPYGAWKGGRKPRCWSDEKMAENKIEKMSHLKNKWREKWLWWKWSHCLQWQWLSSPPCPVEIFHSDKQDTQMWSSEPPGEVSQDQSVNYHPGVSYLL